MTEFVDEIPAATGFDPGKNKQFYADLEANPGRWAKYPQKISRRSMDPTASRLRRRGLDAVIRNGVLYVRKPVQ